MLPDRRSGQILRARMTVTPFLTFLVIPAIVFVGMLNPIQARINGELGRRLEDSISAALISFGSGLILITITTYALPSGRRALRRLRGEIKAARLSKWNFLAGTFGACMVLSQTLAVGLIGVALFMVAMVAGQAVGSTLVDHFGLAPGVRRPVTPVRLFGTLLVVVAVLVSLVGNPSFQGSNAFHVLGPLILTFLAGIGNGFQLGMNGRIAQSAGLAMVAGFTNFVAGTLVLLIAWIIKISLLGPPAPLPGDWWLYLGGIFGITLIPLRAVLMRGVGVLVLSLSMLSGQLLGSLILDLALPTPTTHLSQFTYIGLLLTFLAVVLVGAPKVFRLRRRRDDAVFLD
jgi:transporter family-2 protein